jgi:hypothetical protein
MSESRLVHDAAAGAKLRHPQRDRRFASTFLKRSTRHWLEHAPVGLIEALWADDVHGELAIASLANIDRLPELPSYATLTSMVEAGFAPWALDVSMMAVVLARFQELHHARQVDQDEPSVDLVRAWLDEDPAPIPDGAACTWSELVTLARIWADGEVPALEASGITWSSSLTETRLALHELTAVRDAAHLARLKPLLGRRACTLGLARAAASGDVRIWVVEVGIGAHAGRVIGAVSVERRPGGGWVAGKVWPALGHNTYPRLAKIAMAMASRYAAADFAARRREDLQSRLARFHRSELKATPGRRYLGTAPSASVAA